MKTKSTHSLSFPKIFSVARRSDNNESAYFKYELCSHPLSLFDNNGLLRNAENELAKAITHIANYDPLKSKIDNGVRENVLDGGRLLHLIKWNKNEKFSDIYKRCSSFLLNTYGHATIC